MSIRFPLNRYYFTISFHFKPFCRTSGLKPRKTKITAKIFNHSTINLRSYRRAHMPFFSLIILSPRRIIDGSAIYIRLRFQWFHCLIFDLNIFLITRGVCNYFCLVYYLYVLYMYTHIRSHNITTFDARLCEYYIIPTHKIRCFCSFYGFLLFSTFPITIVLKFGVELVFCFFLIFVNMW